MTKKDIVVNILIDSVASQITKETPQATAYKVFLSKSKELKKEDWLDKNFLDDIESFNDVWFPKIKRSQLY